MMPEMSETKIEVLKHLVSGLSNREIGEKMGIKFNTVKSHVKLIYRKLGVTNRGSAINKVFHMGYKF